VGRPKKERCRRGHLLDQEGVDKRGRCVRCNRDADHHRREAKKMGVATGSGPRGILPGDGYTIDVNGDEDGWRWTKECQENPAYKEAVARFIVETYDPNDYPVHVRKAKEALEAPEGAK
jgi:hypothetical protein